MIHVLIADDHPLITDGLCTALEGRSSLRLVGVAENGRAVLELAARRPVDVVLMDIDMPEMDGIEAARRLRIEHPGIRIIILTMHAEAALMQRLVADGVDGYLLKTAGADEVVRAIEQVHAGTPYFSARVTTTLAAAATRSAVPPEPLTDRELEILKLVAQGLTNKEIAEQLFISHRTVDTHRTNLMRKLNVNNVAGLVRYAFQQGLVR